MTRLIVTCIRVYQALQRALGRQQLPFLVASGCRSWPTCSEYTINEVQAHGPIKGVLRGVLRILRCNPLFAVRTH